VLHNYIIAYDICDKKRLASLATCLEKECVRIQYSIFYAQAYSDAKIERLKQKMVTIIDVKKDDVRVYTLAKDGHIAIAQAYNIIDLGIVA